MKTMGFYAIVTYGLKEYEPIPILKIYRMRGEQEQCFEIEKEVNGQDKLRSYSQDGRQGSLCGARHKPPYVEYCVMPS